MDWRKGINVLDDDDDDDENEDDLAREGCEKGNAADVDVVGEYGDT